MNEARELFHIKSGLRQGDGLSLIVINLILAVSRERREGNSKKIQKR